VRLRTVLPKEIWQEQVYAFNVWLQPVAGAVAVGVQSDNSHLPIQAQTKMSRLTVRSGATRIGALVKTHCEDCSYCVNSNASDAPIRPDVLKRRWRNPKFGLLLDHIITELASMPRLVLPGGALRCLPSSTHPNPREDFLYRASP
jgi:hypothetical protein